MRSINLKSIYLILATVIVAIIIGISAQTETVKANDDICDTWDAQEGICHGPPTNCLCAIIVEG